MDCHAGGQGFRVPYTPPLKRREALIALMLEKGWEAVTVQDICERADVGGQVVVRRFRELIVTLVREDLAHGHDASAPATEAAARFISGGFLELLTWWLESRNALQPPDIERLFLQMATPAIEMTNERV